MALRATAARRPSSGASIWGRSRPVVGGSAQHNGTAHMKTGKSYRSDLLASVADDEAARDVEAGHVVICHGLDRRLIRTGRFIANVVTLSIAVKARFLGGGGGSASWRQGSSGGTSDSGTSCGGRGQPHTEHVLAQCKRYEPFRTNSRRPRRSRSATDAPGDSEP